MSRAAWSPSSRARRGAHQSELRLAVRPFVRALREAHVERVPFDTAMDRALSSLARRAEPRLVATVAGLRDEWAAWYGVSA